MSDSYKTIVSESEGLFKDRGSKFISFAYPVSSENEIREILEKLRKDYHDARHHCYAWRLNANGSPVRANDDGEPSNSAGKPILNQIEARELTNILIVVVRYFGGTLLGVGGLINAYRTAAEEALNGAKIIKKFIYKSLEIRFDYSMMSQVMKIIKENDLSNYDHRFEISCSLKLRVRQNELNETIELFKIIDGCEVEEVTE